MIHHLLGNKRKHITRKPLHERVTMLYPWEIPEVQELDEVNMELSLSRDTSELESDIEPGWGALMEATLRDESMPSAAA